MSERPQLDLPFTYLLSSQDQADFRALRQCLSDPVTNTHQRNPRIWLVQQSLLILRRFYLRGQNDDWRRCLICGLCWSENGDSAVNTRQLRTVLGKSKSSLNGAFAAMNYGPDFGERTAAETVCQATPYLQGKTAVLWQWRIRRAQRNAPSMNSEMRPDSATRVDETRDRDESEESQSTLEFGTEGSFDWSEDGWDYSGSGNGFMG